MFSFVKNLFKNFCWHDWKKVYEEDEYYFLYEKCIRLDLKFRVCQKCGKAQRYDFTIAGGPYWEPLTSCETKVLLSKIKDKGDYYILKQFPKSYHFPR